MRRCFSGLVLLLCLVEVASARTPQPIYDPGGRALDHFHRALSRTARGVGTTRILQFGASHTEADRFTGHLRQFFQHRFGDGGHGYIMPVRPWRGYGHRDVDLSSTDTWFTDKAYRRDARQDGLYGLAGFSCSSGSTEDFGRISTSTRSAFGQSVARFDVYYLEQPNGGRLDVFVDGAHYVRISTAATTPSLGMRVIRVPEGPHELEVRPVGDGEVRLFGIVMERNAPGVVLDSLGIRGARASVWLEWDEEIWGQQLARRHPDLIMLAYGTNESGDTRQPIARYERQLSDVLARLRRISPEASCVLIGPTDRPIRRRREWVHRPRIDQVIEIQRTVGARYGCAFWDAFEAMGGALSIIEWHGMDPPLASRDRVHLTTLGYERLADELARALLSGYPPVR